MKKILLSEADFNTALLYTRLQQGALNHAYRVLVLGQRQVHVVKSTGESKQIVSQAVKNLLLAHARAKQEQEQLLAMQSTPTPVAKKAPVKAIRSSSAKSKKRVVRKEGANVR